MKHKNGCCIQLSYENILTPSPPVPCMLFQVLQFLPCNHLQTPSNATITKDRKIKCYIIVKSILYLCCIHITDSCNIN